MTDPTNHQRADWAASALVSFQYYCWQRGEDDRTLITDLVTDLGHLATERKIDFVEIAAQALSHWAYERKHPNGLGPMPQVCITVEARPPKFAWPARGRAR
jgi:hypothetical protein